MLEALVETNSCASSVQFAHKTLTHETLWAVERGKRRRGDGSFCKQIVHVVKTNKKLGET